MEEDTVKDKIIDFQMMLEGFVNSTNDLCPTDKERSRILTNWYRLATVLESEK